VSRIALQMRPIPGTGRGLEFHCNSERNGAAKKNSCAARALILTANEEC
jgi:hypothetical protein